MTNNIIERDLRHNWHPCTQMKDHELFRLLNVKCAHGPHLELTDGSKLIDANSSWWCKNLGHGHPRLREALLKQAERFEHVIFAGTTNETIVKLSEKLAAMTKTLKRVLYASDGSSAVEAALKMSIHSRLITGETKRTKIAALQNSYHGETILALSATDSPLYSEPYKELLIPITFIQNVPYVNSKDDPLWDNCSNDWKKILDQLEPLQDTLTAIIFEPIVQGAGGMKIYSKDLLKRLRDWTKKHGIHLVADEIMTGFGRTGTPLASGHAGIEPDFICLAKGLTSGWLPMSAILTTDEVYQLFYGDYAKGKNFLHSHTHSGNALAAAVALETIKVLEEEDIYQKVKATEPLLKQLMLEIKKDTGRIKNIRNIGSIVAADLILDAKQKLQRCGYKIMQAGIKHGCLLRPLGNTIYWMPPLNTSESTLLELQEGTKQAIEDVFRSKA